MGYMKDRALTIQSYGDDPIAHMQAVALPKRQRRAQVTPASVMLTLIRIVKTERRRSFHDERHMVIWTVAEYRGSDGEMYRKGFEAKGHDPVIPQSGTHASIGIQLKQW